MHMLDSVIKILIQPVLKSNGFKKKGLQWNRIRGEFIDVVTVQEADYSTPQAEVFTVNLGVFVPSFFEAVWRRSPCVFVTEADCVVRARLGDLIQEKPYGDACDEWWTLTDDDVQTGELVINALIEKGLPFLSSFDSFAAVANHLREVKGWQSKNTLMIIYRALAEWKTGDTSAAIELLESVKGKAWAAKASAVSDMICCTPPQRIAPS
jgi:hypothetical protein